MNIYSRNIAEIDFKTVKRKLEFVTELKLFHNPTTPLLGQLIVKKVTRPHWSVFQIQAEQHASLF